VSRSSLDRKTRATTVDSTAPARGSADNRKPSVTRLVARARTRSRADRSAADQRATDGEKVTPAPAADTTEPDHADASVQFVHSTQVFTHRESFIEAHPDAPALCPEAVTRLARDLRAEDLADLLLPARSVAAVFERPLPTLFNMHAGASSETRRPSPSDTFFTEAHGRVNRRPTDDLFRDTRSDIDQQPVERHASKPESHSSTAQQIAPPARPEANNPTASNSKRALREVTRDTHPVRTPRIVEPAISHTEPTDADFETRPTRTGKSQNQDQATPSRTALVDLSVAP